MEHLTHLNLHNYTAGYDTTTINKQIKKSSWKAGYITTFVVGGLILISFFL
jgi:hypothetical protein